MIYVFGAFDRYNYGDLLFVKILKFFLSEKGFDNSRMKFLGLVDVDLRRIGGDEVEIFSKYITKFNPEDVLIVAGGEVLGARIEVLYHYIYNNPLLLLMWKCEKRFSIAGLSSYYYRKRLNLNTNYPYELSSKKLGCKIIYNAVGGVPANPHILNDALYFSVRSPNAQKHLNDCKSQFDHDCKLYPDSVAIMSEYYNMEAVRLNVSKENLSLIDEFDGNYISFQIKKSYYNDHRMDLIRQIEQLSKETSYAIIFVPIGIALGHEDVYACEQLCEEIETTSHVLKPESIFDIMYGIVKSKLFIGTSLHGNITAMSYDVPHMGLGPMKLDEYLKTWAGGIQKRGCVDVSSICETAKKILDQPLEEFKCANDLHKQGARLNLENIVELL